MKVAPNFEMVKIADDYMLIPVGDQMDAFNGTVVLNDVSAFLLEKMKNDMSEDELVRLTTEEFDVDFETAQADVKMVLDEMMRIGIIYA